MCGIAGGTGPRVAGALESMVALQRHRGPDDGGTWRGADAAGTPVALGSRRLAIRDLSADGHMPMRSADGGLTLVYNGEIYNYAALRRELEADGVRFRSDADTEVVLEMYRRHGADCVDRLEGMFAFAVWDAPRDRLFLARDHFGIKPLYWTVLDGQLAFASEIKSLLAVPGFEVRMSDEALHRYLTLLWVPDPLTMFEGVWKLPAGHRAVWQRGELSVERYWDLGAPDEGTSFPRAEADLAAELRERFAATVESQMASDVPLGAFLSAGLDSSSIVACMARAATEPVRTFTIAFPEDQRRGEVHLDDTEVAARTAKHFGCIHRELRVEPDVVDLLPRLVWHMDEPVADPAIITAFLVNREARRDVTVLLSGVGGDELFAGYRKYQAHGLAERYRRIPAPLRTGLIEPAILALPSLRGSRFKGHVRLAKKMARSGSLPPEERFMTDSVYMDAASKSRLYTDATRARMAGFDPLVMHREHFRALPDAEFVDRMMYVDVKAFMTSLNLTYNDKMSMASSVEVRVPFLDRSLAEWVAANVPPELKLAGNTTKHILREAMRPWLPAEVLVQKKAGFAAPVDAWLAGALRPMVDELLSAGTVRRRGLFEPAEVARLVSEQRSGRQDWSMQIWQLLTLELWQQAFMDDPARFADELAA